MRRRDLLGTFAAASALTIKLAAAETAVQSVPHEPESDVWQSLAEQVFPGRSVEDAGPWLTIEAPYRAEDAALVPVTMRAELPPGDGRSERRTLRGLTLVIDANPSPLAARFAFGPDAGVSMVGLRVRVDDYTNMHAVAELSDGRLYVVRRYVKAAGGCSAPAAKEASGAIPLGTMRMRVFPAADAPPAEIKEGRREAQIMVRHPNYSGMQMDQVTRLYVPAHFVESVKVFQGDAPLFTLESGISIAENPTIRFDYRPNGAASFRVEAEDNMGGRFAGSFPIAGVPS